MEVRAREEICKNIVRNWKGIADSITIADALKELNELATAHPDTAGLDAVRALLPSPS